MNERRKVTINGKEYFLCEKVTIPCERCGKTRQKWAHEFRRSPHSFCSRSCASLWSIQNYERPPRRSKLEVWIEERLNALYPHEDILYNDNSAINSDLDIYFPRLKLAFELNGTVHYEPIYGQETLKYMQNNDKRKFQACLERGIELCIIDASWIRYIKPERGQKILDIITGILKQKGL